MKLHLAATLALCVVTAAHAEAMRIKCVDGPFTSWGTCVAIDEHSVLTANHVVEKGNPAVELAGKWEPATVVARDKECDLALLKVEATIKDFHELLDMPSLTLYASAGISGPGDAGTTPVEKHEVRLISIDIGGEVGHGNSGAPVVVNGGSPVIVNDSIVGIVVAVEVGDKPRMAKCVPAGTIKRFLQVAGWKKEK
jgi:hypothetical protein